MNLHSCTSIIIINFWNTCPLHHGTSIPTPNARYHFCVGHFGMVGNPERLEDCKSWSVLESPVTTCEGFICYSHVKCVQFTVFLSRILGYLATLIQFDIFVSWLCCFSFIFAFNFTWVTRFSTYLLMQLFQIVSKPESKLLRNNAIVLSQQMYLCFLSPRYFFVT